MRAKNDAGEHSAKRKHKKSYQHRWESTFGKTHTVRWHPRSIIELAKKEGKPMLLLVVLGVCASILDYGIESGVRGLSDLRDLLLSMESMQSTSSIKFLVWSAFTFTVALLGMLCTRFVDPVAAGSGIPEMKTIISCDLRKEADDFLGRHTLVSKAVGLMLAMGSGVSLGKEGPFVHTASIIAHQLMKHIGFFQRIYENAILRRHMYNAACAVGIASTFRAPIGGVLFAIEVTSTVFMVTNYWRAFVAAISASIARQLISLIRETEVTAFHPMYPTSFKANSFSFSEFIAFAILGVFMGVGGAAYVTLSGYFKRWWKLRTAKYPFLSACALLVATCCVLYLPGSFGRKSFTETIRELCSPTDLLPEWRKVSVFFLLPCATLCRLVATAFSTSLPLPAGDFIPTFIAGASLGRFYGEIVAACFPDSDIIPGGYALVGGAAFVGSATHTVSVAVIAMEFTGQFIYITPLILAVLLASGIGSALSVSLYESIIISKGLTYLPLLRVNQLEGFKARDVMDTGFSLVPLETSSLQLQSALDRNKTSHSFPVVESVESMIFLGCVSRESLKLIVEATQDTPSKVDAVSSPVPVSETLNEVHINVHGEGQLDTLSPPALQPPTPLPRQISLRNHPSIFIDSSALQVTAEAPVETVHLLFEMIKCSRIWVTNHGRLIGSVHRKHLPSLVCTLRRESQSIVA